jgi:hypothetical protein
MKFIELIRVETSPSGTVGILLLDKQLFCVTLELPKKDNERAVSCIPTGQYICKRYDSEKYLCPCLAVHNVHGRENISMHYGNTLKDTKGCILIGTYTGYIESERAVHRSKDALNDLMNSVRDICHLTISERF